MDKLLTGLGSLLAVLAIGFGGVHADARPSGQGAAGNAPVARPKVVLKQFPALPAPVPGAPAPDASGVLGFPTLAEYEYQQGMANLPDGIRALDGKEVTMRGFLLPLYEFDDIKTFILVANHMSCCFGIPAGMNGQIYVALKGGRGLPNTNEPLEIKGTFHARERSEQGYVLSIFEVVDATARIVGY